MFTVWEIKVNINCKTNFLVFVLYLTVTAKIFCFVLLVTHNFGEQDKLSTVGPSCSLLTLMGSAVSGAQHVNPAFLCLLLFL